MSVVTATISIEESQREEPEEQPVDESGQGGSATEEPEEPAADDKSAPPGKPKRKSILSGMFGKKSK